MQKATFTVAQFCDQHNTSRSFFYELIKQGKGPRLMKVGRRTLISAEAAAEWRRSMEAPATEDISDFLRNPVIG
ncbi:hypothetical protein BTL55_17025 [Bordetella trematum]|uniref:hypothetical protein n=1 Tax=Bordetella trematum TaxID=123899 RepID=UPI000C7647A3|nr:hypothetical protein [Bordetella trematum]AUL48472.1 hypothetical protein BTL55_17025 [Bordetella trematum]